MSTEAPPTPRASVTCRAQVSADTAPGLTFVTSLIGLAAPVRERVAELGLDTLRTPEARNGFAALGPVQRYRAHTARVRAAEARATDATRAFHDLTETKRSLLANPTATLSDDLRRVTAELHSAAQAKARAEFELTEARRPTAKLFAAAANAIANKTKGHTLEMALALNDAEGGARSRTEEACSKIAEILRAAVEEHLIGLIVEHEATVRAGREAWTGGNGLSAELCDNLLGEAPNGVRAVNGIIRTDDEINDLSELDEVAARGAVPATGTARNG